jgi:hypothetical protein
MGRHSASYIAAQQRLSTGPTALGAAKYVGRVGALALAMGIGAAAIGGAGLANATEGSGAASPSDGAKTVSDPTSGTAPTADPKLDAPDGATGDKTPKPSSPDVPKMVFSGGVPTHSDPLSGVLSKISNQLAAVFGNGSTGLGAPTGERDELPAGSRASDSRQARSKLTDDDAAASFVRTKTDDLAATFRASAKPVDVDPPSVPDTTLQSRLDSSLSAAPVAASLTGFTAPTQPAAPQFANPVVTLVSGVLNAFGFSPTATTGGTPVTPFPILTAALQLIHREIERFVTNLNSAAAFYNSAQPHVPPATATGVLLPGDETPTAYGDIGKWMLEPDGQISDYGGQPYQGKTLLEPVNVIIVDPTSTSAAEATQKLNAAMFWGGFPAQPIHSTGFLGKIDTVIYGQQPSGLLQGFSDNLFIFPNDHGRIFGPDPVETSTGYVWSGAFSTEVLSIYNFLPAHSYVSSDMARTALATRLILTGQATYVGMVPLNNAVNNATTTTGDHDGYAVVLRLN